MRLVDDDHMPAPQLDDDALPAGWSDWISCEATACGCPRDYVAAGMIGAASAWIGNARRVAATADWNEPAQLWFALIGAPSAGKTPALRPMIDASRALESDAEPEWQRACAQHERDAEAAKALKEVWRAEVRSAATRGVELPSPPGDVEEPPRPPRPRLVAMDSSTEELQRLLADAPRGLLYVRDELAGWLGGFDRYSGCGVPTAHSFSNAGMAAPMFATASAITARQSASSMPRWGLSAVWSPTGCAKRSAMPTTDWWRG
jgi:hypothetical protein